MQSGMRSLRFRLYPTAEQEERLSQWAGVARFTYNLALEQRRDWWRQYKHHRGQHINFATQSREMTDVRAQAPWLRDAPRCIIEYALRDLDSAMRAMFAGAGFPNFRSKGRNCSFRMLGRSCRVSSLNRKWATLDLSKGLRLRMRVTRPIPRTFTQVAATRIGDHWYAVIVAREMVAPVCVAPDAIGIDRGVAISLALSNGEQHLLPGSIAATVGERRKAQAILARRKFGSRRREKQRLAVRDLYAKAAASRKHWLHERSTDIANRFGQVAIEKLATSNMTRTGRGKRGLNRSILEQGWATFANMLEYKLADRGGVLHYVNPAYTSQTCSCCGSVNAESRKSQAVFECVDCGHRANADTNAAINILRRSPAGVEGAGYGPVEARTGAARLRRENLTASAAGRG